MDLFSLKGRVAIVTGGNGGIGLGIAAGLAGAGADIVIAARNTEKNAAAVKRLEGLGVRAISVPTDVRKEADCRAAVEKAVGAFGRLDILVNNAGINHRKLPHEYSLEEFNEVIAVNLTSAFIFSHAAYPHFIKAGGGKVINIGSVMTYFGSPVSVAYGASKGGIVQMTKALTVAWAKDNIQANAILPGWINTDLTKGARAYNPALEQQVIDRTPAGRWGEPEDFAGVAVFLASRASNFVNGETIFVDGGFTTKG